MDEDKKKTPRTRRKKATGHAAPLYQVRPWGGLALQEGSPMIINQYSFPDHVKGDDLAFQIMGDTADLSGGNKGVLAFEMLEYLYFSSSAKMLKDFGNELLKSQGIAEPFTGMRVVRAVSDAGVPFYVYDFVRCEDDGRELRNGPLETGKETTEVTVNGEVFHFY